MKIRNIKTGEVIDLSSKGSSQSKNKTEESDKRIEERGTIQETAKKIISEKSTIKKIGAGLEVASSPLNAVESAISNPILEAQKGNIKSNALMSGGVGVPSSNTKETTKDMGKAIKEAMLGLSLQKQGQYGDIMKNMGVNPILADTGGLVLNLAPVKIYAEVAKTFGAISKMSDKGLLKAGDNLLHAVNQAKEAAGTKVTQEFANLADNIPVDGLKWIDDIAKLPKSVADKAESTFGNLADFANGLTIGKLREFKRFLGKLRPSAYGQEARGIQENIDVQDLNKVYSNLKKRMTETIEKNIDKKTSDYLMGLEDSFSDIADAGRYIRKNVNDSIMEIPSRVGELSQKVASDLNSSARIALTRVKKASSQAEARINKAMQQIDNFNRNQAIKKVAGHITNAVVYGGVAGGIGGRILSKAQQGGQSE